MRDPGLPIRLLCMKKLRPGPFKNPKERHNPRIKLSSSMDTEFCRQEERQRLQKHVIFNLIQKVYNKHKTAHPQFLSRWKG